MGMRRCPCEGPRSLFEDGQGGKKRGSRNVRSQLFLGMIIISSLVDSTVRGWVRCFLTKMMALWIGIMASPK